MIGVCTNSVSSCSAVWTGRLGLGLLLRFCRLDFVGSGRIGMFLVVNAANLLDDILGCGHQQDDREGAAVERERSGEGAGRALAPGGIAGLGEGCRMWTRAEQAGSSHLSCFIDSSSGIFSSVSYDILSRLVIT